MQIFLAWVLSAENLEAGPKNKINHWEEPKNGEDL